MPHHTVAPNPHHHSVSFYDHDHEVVELVAHFAVDALKLDERVVIVATPAHRSGIDELLALLDVDAAHERATGRLVMLDAATTLATFLVDGAPDRDLFADTIGGVLDRASAGGSTVRVFGEMVGLLWEAGNVTGALELETLWNDLIELRRFQLLCAYSTASMATARLADLGGVCARHTRLLPPSSYEAGGHGETSDPQLSRVFLPVPEAVAAVRHFVTRILERWQEGGLASDAALVASELATNAVLHADSPFRVSVDRSIGVVCIAIQDVHLGRAEQQQSVAGAVSGRGMAIVEAVARRWGCDALPGGKVVWAELSASG